MENAEYKSMDFGLKMLLNDAIFKRTISFDQTLDEIKGQILDAYILGYNRGKDAQYTKARDLEITSPRRPIYQITRNLS